MASPDDVKAALARWQAELTASAEKIGEVLEPSEDLSGDDIEPDDSGTPPEPEGSWWDQALSGRLVTPAVWASVII